MERERLRQRGIEVVRDRGEKEKERQIIVSTMCPCSPAGPSSSGLLGGEGPQVFLQRHHFYTAQVLGVLRRSHNLGWHMGV